MQSTSLTTSALIDLVKADPLATERELTLLDRLCSAMDEIDDLVDALTRERGEAEVAALEGQDDA